MENRDLNLRRSVHEKLKLGKDGEQPLWNKFKITVTHVVHQVYVSNITENGSQRSISCKNAVADGVVKSIKYAMCSANG